MRIRRVECDQFAGLKSKKIEFENGMNIVIGDNESGKSTLIDLIFQLLFKDVKIDGRSDSDFIDKYFPKKISGPQGNVIDGVIIFETSEGIYKLKKEWEKNEGVCRLILPDGTSIKGFSEINEILMKELKHRAGVYSEIVFASQKRKQVAIESIMRSLGKKMDSLSNTRSDLTSILTKAVLETGGVSIDKLEKTIKKNMDELIGRWDCKADAPEGGPKRASYKNAWSNGLGLIAKAYYAADEIRSKQIEEENAELAVEEEKSAIHTLQNKKKEVEAERTKFQRFRGIIGQRALLEGALEDLKLRIIEQSEAYEKWPGIRSDIEKAQKLQKKQKNAQVRALYMKVEPAQRMYLEKKKEFEKLKEIDIADIRQLRELITNKQIEEAKLSGINLLAKIKEISSTEIKITSMTSGKSLDLSTGEALISESVDITVPGILKMQLIPLGIDIEVVKKVINKYQEEIKELLVKFDANSLEELQAKSDAYNELRKQVDKLKLEIDRILGDKSWQELKAAYASVPTEIETEMEIKRSILDLCGVKSVESFIGGLESTLLTFEKKYESIDCLKDTLDKQKEDLEVKKKQLDSMDDIPKEYQGIKDPEKYDANLLSTIENFEIKIQEHREKLSKAERNLGDKSAEEYLDDLLEKESNLKAKKAEYDHWQNIYSAFCRLKKETGGSPIDNIESTFREYLRIITDGTLVLNSFDEQMSAQLASGSNVLTYDILSDGTKDTISLAFRLAMLEYLYPNGDGLAVFDDPFIDMDAKRVKQSCELIQRFAENNQVIFVTCNPKYQSFLSGNIVSVSR